jgi:hypothetical protein
VELLGTLLAVHAIYFQRQRCRDRFEGALGIHALREAEHSAGGTAAAQPAPGTLQQISCNVALCLCRIRKQQDPVAGMPVMSNT